MTCLYFASAPLIEASREIAISSYGGNEVGHHIDLSFAIPTAKRMNTTIAIKQEEKEAANILLVGTRMV